MFLDVVKMIFFDLLGGLLLLSCAVFLFYTIATLLLLGRHILDFTLSLGDRLWLCFAMVLGLVWGSWMVYFSFTMGLSCLTN